MLRKIRAWYDERVRRALAKQEDRLRADIEETKRLPRTPERDKLIVEAEALLASGASTPSDALVGAEIAAVEADLKHLRTGLALDQAREERMKLSRRIDKLAEASKKIP